MKLFSQNYLGIDLGTSNCRIYVNEQGIVLREPSLLCVQAEDMRQVLAMGEEAKVMLGRTPGTVVALRPMIDGVIADSDVAEVMLGEFIGRALKRRKSLVPPRAVIGVPSSITLVERRAVEDSLRNTGLRQIYIVEIPVASAIGAGLDISKPEGSLIADIGGGTTEIAVISMGGNVVSKSFRVAGNKMDEAIISFIKREYNLLIGEKTAEAVKVDIGSAVPHGTGETCVVRGRDLVTGLPQIIEINNDDIYEALQDPINQIISAICDCLENTPPELAGDIMRKGIYLCGGSSQLHGLDTRISQETGMPVHIAENPTDCLAVGCGKLSEDPVLLHMVLDKFEER